MQVTLLGKNFIQKLTLPNVKIGNYWMSYNENQETERRLLNIEGRGENWRLISSNYSKIIDPQDLIISNNEITFRDKMYRVISTTVLKDYNMYCVKIGNEIFIVYCSPVYDENIKEIELNHKNEITIGRDSTNDIRYNNVLVADKHAKISFYNGRWTIENYDTKFGVYVNDVPVYKKSRILVNGDVVFIMGLKIIIMGRKLFINNPLNQMEYNENIFDLIEEKKYHYNETSSDDENETINLNETYYSRAPRIINKIEHEKIKIDPPPEEQKKDGMPAVLVLGTTISMGLIMVLSMSNSISGISNGIDGKTIMQILLTILMFISVVAFPILQRKYEKKQKIKHEEKRQKRYKDYIDSKIQEIDEIMTKQRNILVENYPSVEECMNIILSRNPRLWERKIENFDFLTLRLGTGEIPLDIDIQYPEKSFTMEDDNLVEILNKVANKSKILEDAPITMSLVENNITGLISKNDEEKKIYMKNLIMQLITFHSYEDLKLVVLLDDDKEKRWDYLKMLPHTWDDSRTIRLFTDRYDEMKEISMYLEEEFKNRVQYQGANYKQFSPYYLIITDNYKKIENLKIITEILGTEANLGFSIFCIASDLTQLPDESKTFISLENGQGKIYESEMTSDKQQTFQYDSSERIFFDRDSQVLLNIPIKFTQNGVQGLPSTYTFLQMYDAGNIEQLNTLERWRKNDSTLSLKAPIGIDNTGNTVYLDIHEKFHGPHGIIAGSTGSGKSEFLITYILSLAINYHPDDLSMIIIDYKGGGLAGAFQKGNIKLPHLVGTITNIDTVELQRSLASIQSELRRRQIIFNEARNQTDEGTIDIYKYQKLYHNGVVKTPIPHLLIICDEFAELKQQQPDFMEELMSVSRIGRSLGVHLILATQKPAGIINDQIRSNSRFAICLKVQNREESIDVIRKPDAANLKNVGQFYLEVGNDEYFVLGQSAWAGAPYIPSYETKKTVDTSIDFISNIGSLIKKVDDTKVTKGSNQGEQLTNIVKYIYELAKREKIESKQLWLPNIPETIYLDEVKKKYNIKPNSNEINVTIGEYDDPQNQYQGIATLKLANDGNAVI